VTVERVEFLVEEPSMEVALRALLPKMLDAEFEIFPHQCKDELLARLPDRLRGYARWLPPTWRVVVIVDSDNEDCRVLKSRLERICRRSGLPTRTTTPGPNWRVVTRLAIEETRGLVFR
jgi:hypothetical protein